MNESRRASTISEPFFSRRGVIIAVVVMIVFILTAIFIAFAYSDPLTDAQALVAIQDLGVIYQAAHPGMTLVDAELAVAAHRVSVLDYILEGPAPQAMLPAHLLILQGRDLVESWQPPMIVLPVGPDPKDPYVEFDIPLDGKRMKDFVPLRSPWPIIAGVVAASVGAVVLDEALPLPNVLRQGAAAVGGAGAGLAVWFLSELF